MPINVHANIAGGLLARQRDANFRYLMELDEENILYNYRQEAGLVSLRSLPEGFHGGWELPTCQLRGHFTGHWLSGTARMYRETGDGRHKARAAYVVQEIARCQQENGGEWCFTIPEKYLWWIRDGKSIWAPHYTLHKTLMGLADACEYAGIEQAADIARGAAKWFLRYTEGISRDEMSDLMDRTETGGMMEAWADLYRLTGDEDFAELMRRYERPRYYEALLRGEDVLTNMHANTTIPEILGVCKAYEVTGEARYLAIAKAYWKLAVEDRGFYATGGQTSGEVWSPMRKQAARLGDKNQEHCTVYNMMRLADFLFRVEGDARYMDYWERNLYNGILAQGYYQPFYPCEQTEETPETSEIVSYFLPMQPGAKKRWGSKTDDFWCCHGTLVQANATMLGQSLCYAAPREVYACQFFPYDLTLPAKDVGLAKDVKLSLRDDISGEIRAEAMRFALTIEGQGQAFAVKIRVPWWIAGAIRIEDEAGREIAYEMRGGFARIDREWGSARLNVTLPKTITLHPLDDAPGYAAFLDGPVALAGLTDGEPALAYDPDHPRALFTPDDERQWGTWKLGWKTVGQKENLRFTPLYNIHNQRYTLYFPRA